MTYNLNVPVSSGTYKFIDIWTYPEGFNKQEANLEVSVAPTTTQPPVTQPETTQPEEQEETEGTTIPPIVYIIVAIVGIIVIYKFVIEKRR